MKLFSSLKTRFLQLPVTVKLSPHKINMPAFYDLFFRGKNNLPISLRRKQKKTAGNNIKNMKLRQALFFTIFLICTQPAFSWLSKEKFEAIKKNPFRHLQQIIDDLVPAPPANSEFSITVNGGVMSFRIIIPEERLHQFTYGDKTIVNIDFLVTSKRCLFHKINGCFGPITEIFVLYFSDGSWEVFRHLHQDIPGKELADCMMAITHFVAEFGLQEKVFHSPSGHGSSRWVEDFSYLSDEGGFNDIGEMVYSYIENSLIDQMIRWIHKKEERQQKAKKGILLVCLGCGLGTEVKSGYNRLSEEFSTPVYACGSDYNKTLVETAREFHEGFRFYNADARCAAEIMTQCRRDAPEHGLVLVVAQGLITDQVLDGTYSALRVLQQLAVSDSVDALFASGFANSLITSEMASASGWSYSARRLTLPKKLIDMHSPTVLDYNLVVNANMVTPRYLYVLMPLTAHQQKNKIIRASQKERFSGISDVLDLSMSSFPGRYLPELFSEPVLQQSTIVDLSWSQLPQDWKPFLQQLADYGVTTLIASGHEIWFKKVEPFIQQTNLMNIVLRVDSYSPMELPSLPFFLTGRLIAPGIPLLIDYYQKKKKEEQQESEEKSRQMRVSFLDDEKRKMYLDRLKELLKEHHLQLSAVSGNGLCLLNALGNLLNLTAFDVQTALLQAAFEISGTNNIPEMLLQEACNDMLNQGWGGSEYFALASHAFKKKILLITANPANGHLQFQLFHPQGAGDVSESLPAGLDLNDILIVVHNAQGHFMPALNAEVNLDAGTLAQLDENMLASPAQANPQQPSEGGVGSLKELVLRTILQDFSELYSTAVAIKFIYLLTGHFIHTYQK